MTFEPWDPLEVWPEWQEDKKTKDKNTEIKKRQRNRKRVRYCYVRAVSHSCESFFSRKQNFCQKTWFQVIVLSDGVGSPDLTKDAHVLVISFDMDTSVSGRLLFRRWIRPSCTDPLSIDPKTDITKTRHPQEMCLWSVLTLTRWPRGGWRRRWNI